MASRGDCPCPPRPARHRAFCGLALILAVAVALPEELPAAPAVETDSMQPPVARPLAARPGPVNVEILLAHCCHAHPLPPYDAYCCHSGGGAVVVVPGYGYGPAGVRGESRRVARRTARRVSRRR